MFKGICLSIVIVVSFSAAAQNVSDAEIKQAATATCNCLENEKISDDISSTEAQAIFGKCLMTSASDIVMKMMSGGDDMLAVATKLGEKLFMQMMAEGCSAVTKLSMAMQAGSGDLQEQMEMLKSLSEGNKLEGKVDVEAIEYKSAEGTILTVEEKDFLSLTIKTGAGRELKFLYYTYVDGSDEWIRDAATKLKNKQVTISYIETEVYQAAIKEFTQIKVIKELTIK